MQQEFAVATTLPGHVQRLNVLQDRRIGRARVLEVECPLDGGKVVAYDRDATDDEPGFRIRPGQSVFAPPIIEFANATCLFQLGKSSADDLPPYVKENGGTDLAGSPTSSNRASTQWRAVAISSSVTVVAVTMLGSTNKPTAAETSTNAIVCLLWCCRMAHSFRACGSASSKTMLLNSGFVAHTILYDSRGDRAMWTCSCGRPASCHR